MSTPSSATPTAIHLVRPNAGLELRALACERGGRTLFSGLSANAGPAVLLRVQGANGSGKTSLLRMVSGLLAPAQGDVLWNGTPIARLAEDYGQDMVYLGHAAAIKDDLSGVENLVFACLLGGLAVAPKQAAVALQQAGLDGRENMHTRLLSQGQRRRVALARLLLAASTPLWVLDEPFNALDRLAGEWLCGLLAAHLARGGTVVLTSHQDVGLEGLPDQVTVSL